MGVMNSRLVLSLQDDLTRKAAQVSGEVNKLAASLAASQKQLAAADPFKNALQGLGVARGKFAEAQKQVEQLARQFKEARAAAAQMASPEAARRVKELGSAYAKAQRDVSKAAASLERQGEIAKKARDAFTGGAGITSIGSHERSLRAQIEATTNALREQTAAENAAASAAQRHVGAMRRQVVEGRRVSEFWSRHGAGGYMAAGAAGVVSAHGVAHGIKDTVLSGAKYQHEVTALQNAGRTPHEMEEIEAASKRVAAMLPTATYAENLKVINETTGAFGDLHHAIENLPFMQKAASILHASAGDKVHQGAGELGNTFARFFEMRGSAGDTPLFQKEAGEMIKAMVFSRGNFNPHEMLNFAQQAKDSLQNYSLRFMSRIMPSLVTEVGGERAGTQANAFNTVLMGRVNDQKQTQEWMRYGLLDPKQVMSKAGHAISWRAGAVKNTNQALSDPFEWVEQTLLPALKAKGVNVDDKLELAKVLGTMFRNSNSRAFVNELAQGQNRVRLHKDEKNIGLVKDPDEIYDANLKTDPTVAIKALTASLDNLMATVSGPAMTTAASALTSIAGGLNAVANAAKDHPIAALATGSGLAAGALGASGYLSYQLMRGFGLSDSATALTGSAEALTAAAGRLGAPGAPSTVAPVTTGLAAGAAAGAEGGTAAAVAGRLGSLADMTTGAALRAFYLPIFAGLGLNALLGIKPQEGELGDVSSAGSAAGDRLRGRKRVDASEASGNMRPIVEAAGEAGRQGSAQLLAGFDVSGFAATGNQAGTSARAGFVGVDWASAGSQAGQSLLASFKAVTAGMSFGGGTAGQTPAPSTPGRASGGYVGARHVYMVGEHGPETFVPGEAGHILPRGRARARGTGGGVTANITLGGISITHQGDAESLVETVRDKLEAGLRETVRSLLGDYGLEEPG